MPLSHPMGEQAGIKCILIDYASYAAIASYSTAPPLLFPWRNHC